MEVRHCCVAVALLECVLNRNKLVICDIQQMAVWTGNVRLCPVQMLSQLLLG